MLICPNCGTENVNIANFCLECGHRISNKIIESSENYEHQLLKYNDMIIISIGNVEAIGFSISNLPLNAVDVAIQNIDEEKSTIDSILSGLRLINPPERHLNSHKLFISAITHLLDAVLELRKAVERNSQDHLDKATFHVGMLNSKYSQFRQEYERQNSI